MRIYGVSLLAACFLIGKFLGNLLGELININTDVGGVGFSMIILIVSSIYLKKRVGLFQRLKKVFYFGALFIFL